MELTTTDKWIIILLTSILGGGLLAGLLIKLSKGQLEPAQKILLTITIPVILFVTSFVFLFYS